ncbi:MAG: CPBP family glutamic-type intramembrane protease [Planctomycetaceae bacterium]
MFGTLLIVMLGLASLRVWVEIARRRRRGEPALDPAPQRPSPWLPFASLVAGVYVCLSGLTRADPSETVDISLVQQALGFGLMEILIALTFLTGGFQARLADVGLGLTGFPRQVTDGSFAFLASFGPVMLVLVATSWLRTDETLHPYLKLLREDSSLMAFGWIMLAAVVIAPVREELLFRVMLQDGLARRIGAAPAIGIVAVLFCLVHGFPDSLALLPLALILGYVYQQRQSALSVIVTHALFNLTNLAILLLGGSET